MKQGYSLLHFVCSVIDLSQTMSKFVIIRTSVADLPNGWCAITKQMHCIRETIS